MLSLVFVVGGFLGSMIRPPPVIPGLEDPEQVYPLFGRNSEIVKIISLDLFLNLCGKSVLD